MHWVAAGPEQVKQEGSHGKHSFNTLSPSFNLKIQIK